MKIKAVHFRYFRAGEHHDFLTLFRNRLDGSPTVKAIVIAEYGQFVTLLTEEGDLINLIRKSLLTEQIAEADRRVDRCIVGMRALVTGALHHFNPDVVRAAQSLAMRFDAFGALTQQSYREESDLVRLLIADLQSSAYADQVTLVGLTDWVTELLLAENEFESLMQSRGDEYMGKPSGTLQAVRTAIEAVYHTMTERINAAALVGDSPAEINAFIERLNIDVEYANEHCHHHARKDLGAGDHTVIEPIDTQQYTGEPVTPLTKVYYKDEGKPTEKLVFAKDYEVTYRNNIQVGMAELIVHGKGLYRGQKRIAFMIAR